MPNANGDPIGIEVDKAVRPGLPDGTVVLGGQLCRLEQLGDKAHAADLFEGFRLDSTGALWTYMPHGPFQSVSEFRTWVRQVQGQQDPHF